MQVIVTEKARVGIRDIWKYIITKTKLSKHKFLFKAMLAANLMILAVYLLLLFSEENLYGLMLFAGIMDIFVGGLFLPVIILWISSLYHLKIRTNRCLKKEKIIELYFGEEEVSVWFKGSGRSKTYGYENLCRMEFTDVIFINIPIFIRKNGEIELLIREKIKESSEKSEEAWEKEKETKRGKRIRIIAKVYAIVWYIMFVAALVGLLIYHNFLH